MPHVREHHSLLARAEKRLLVQIASRLPPYVTSDGLTALALAAMIAGGVAVAFIRVSPWSPPSFIVALAVNWLGDSLDGTVARVRRRERPRYGYYVDHVVDLAGTAALVGGKAASGAMTPAIAFAMLAAYCVLAAESYLAAHSLGIFRLSFAGIGPTELRIVLAVGAVAVAVDPWVELGTRRMLLLDLGGVVASVGMLAVFVASSVRNGRALYAAEPLPRADRDRVASVAESRMPPCES
jgi:archaetidylinositol phosphate synthase